MNETTAYKDNTSVGEKALALKNIINHEAVDENTDIIGEANPGTADSAAGWFIYKRYVDSGVEKIRFANGDRKFNKVWSDRTSYTYS